MGGELQRVGRVIIIYFVCICVCVCVSGGVGYIGQVGF